MARAVRIGVVGTSPWTENFHIASLKSHPATVIAAICGRNRTRAEEVAGRQGIPQVFTDYHEMIQGGGLDAILVASPDALHYPITMAALDAGLHVLCEKPMAMNAVQAEEMLNRAQSAGVLHMVMFTFRWAPLMAHAIRLVQEGLIGRPYEAAISFKHGGRRSGNYAWRHDPEHGTGVLGDLGSHMIDLARLLVGEVSSVSASLRSFTADRAPDAANESAVLGLQFTSGAHGTVQLSSMAHLPNGMEIHFILTGEGGTLEGRYNREQSELRGARHGEAEFRRLPHPEDLMAGVDPTTPVFSWVKHRVLNHNVGGRLFVQSILEGEPIKPDFLDGLQAQRVIDSAFESHRTGQRVEVK